MAPLVPMLARIARRLGCVPSDLLKDVAEGNTELLELAGNGMATIHSSSSVPKVISENRHTNLDSLDVMHQEVAGLKNIRISRAKGRDHQRNFSFLPRDAARTPNLSKNMTGLDKLQLVDLNGSLTIQMRVTRKDYLNIPLANEAVQIHLK